MPCYAMLAVLCSAMCYAMLYYAMLLKTHTKTRPEAVLKTRPQHVPRAKKPRPMVLGTPDVRVSVLVVQQQGGKNNPFQAHLR